MAPTLNEIAEQVRKCEKCPLHQTRNLAVPGEGTPQADVMIIGEAPGQYEDKEGRPFVGASGKYMDQLLRDSGVPRNEVFVTNVVKCRPPGDRDPTPTEKRECRPWLDAQIEALAPRMVVTLGAAATQHFRPDARIGQVRARPLKVDGAQYMVLPMYHPAAGMHRESLKSQIAEEFPRIHEWREIMRTNPEEPERIGQPRGEAKDEGHPDLPPLPDTLKPTAPATKRPEGAEPTAGTLYVTVLECEAEMRDTWDLHTGENETDPVATRTRLGVLSAVCATLNRQIQALERGPYQEWCKYRMERIIAVGKTISESTPLLCEDCGATFHPSTTEFRMERWCAACKEAG